MRDPHDHGHKMNSLQDILARPADFLIRTEASLRYFILKSRRTPAAYKPSRAMQVILRLARMIEIGQIDMVLPDGRKLSFIGKQAGATGTLVIHNDRIAKRLLTGGKLGFCEAYLDGDWSSPDITRLFEVVLRNETVLMRALHGKTWFRRLMGLVHAFRSNTKSGSRKNIYAHYDIGNDFYASWLDPSMTYSSALYETGLEDLETAQCAKYDALIRTLDLQPHHHVLEIGCGWGGFAERAARIIGCKVTAITISKAQFDYATDRIKRAGLEHLVTIHLKDYRDLTGQFDRIASIEMFEAVGEAWWPTYFATIHRSLKPGGRAALQIITINEQDFETYRETADYIQAYIFPGGMLPSPSVLRAHVEAAGLSQGHVLSFGRDYARTLAAWNTRFQAAYPQLATRFDMRFKRLWEQYLCYCEAGFNVGTIDVIQIAVDRP